MHTMASSTATQVCRQEARIVLLKRLLRKASPRNPTYILGRIIADFRAQSATELTVCCGEEVFILFELNDWAFATVLSDTDRKGYVPLDYCDVIKDFYELSPHQQTSNNNKVGCSGYSIESHGDKVERVCLTSQRANDVVETDNSSFGYYETKLKRHQAVSTCKKLTTCRDDNLQYFGELKNSTLTNNGSIHCSDSTTGCNELYGEQTTSVKSSRAPYLGRKQDCCCCCENRKCNRNRQEKYNHVLHYLRDSQVLDSHCDDSESGLGDSESILSFSDPHTNKAPIDLNDMSTQTSQSLENIQKQFEKLSAELEMAATEIDKDSCCKVDTTNETCCKRQSYTQPMVSPQPSVDSLLSTSTNGHATTDISIVESDDTDHESTSSFDREDYDTVKRRDSKPVKECTTEELSHISPKRHSILQTHTDKPSNRRKSVHWQTPGWKSLSLPILEKGKIPNKVELTQLSAKIKDKLKPTRDELLHKRSHETTQHEKTDNCVHDLKEQSTAEEETSHYSTTSPALNRKVADNPPASNTGEIKQREMTLQSIQEQYMKLEEARLLHNALKHLHDTMNANEHVETSSNS